MNKFALQHLRQVLVLFPNSRVRVAAVWAGVAGADRWRLHKLLALEAHDQLRRIQSELAHPLGRHRSVPLNQRRSRRGAAQRFVWFF
jgi:hypothetical protein